MKIARMMICLLGVALAVLAQDQTIVIKGQAKYRMALPDFNASGVDAKLQTTFNSVLWNDLYQSAVVTLVGRSLYTEAAPSAEADLANPSYRSGWTADPLSIQRLAFGSLQQNGSGLVVTGYLYDVTQPSGGRLLARRYANPATDAGARSIAHQLANDIVAALGFGPGIAYSPRISPDGQTLAFMSSASGHPAIKLLSLTTNRLLPFPDFAGKGGLEETPAWSPDGKKLAFAMKTGENVEIYTVNANGRGLVRLTTSRGAVLNVSPVWNPKPPAGSPGQIAYVSNRAGALPQLYVMDADGRNQQRLPLGGYAVSPSWSPNGLSLAFAWVRNNGGKNSGASDIYIWNFGSQS